MDGIEVVSVGSMRPKGKSYDINVFQVGRCETLGIVLIGKPSSAQGEARK